MLALLGPLGVTLATPLGSLAADHVAASSPPRCATSGLVVWLDTEGSGTAGSIYYNLEFTNLSGHACTLLGYPGASAVNLAGQQLGSSASRDTTHRSRLITLRNGATAISALRIVEAGNFPASTCKQVTAAGIRVYPPDDSVARVVSFPFGACSPGGPVFLSVQAVT